jgi:hypothetical protein
MAFDFKKECKELYSAPSRPQVVEVPPMNYVAVRGAGDPNEEGGAYQAAVGVLYAVAYTIKMSKKGDHRMDGYFDFVVPPLEGFWWQEGVAGVDYSDKSSFQWISAIRMPDFVTPEELAWAKDTASAKKKIDCSPAELLQVDEGLCVQMMHLGPYDDEPATVAAMDAFLAEQGYANDFSDTRRHHEIYLTDVRKVPPEKWKTVVRHPIRKA